MNTMYSFDGTYVRYWVPLACTPPWFRQEISPELCSRSQHDYILFIGVCLYVSPSMLGNCSHSSNQACGDIHRHFPEAMSCKLPPGVFLSFVIVLHYVGAGSKAFAIQAAVPSVRLEERHLDRNSYRSFVVQRSTRRRRKG